MRFLLLVFCGIIPIQFLYSQIDKQARQKIVLQDGVVVYFQNEKRKGTLRFEGLLKDTQYFIGYDSDGVQTPIVSDLTGAFEIMLYQHERNKGSESFKIESGKYREVFDINWGE